MKTKQKIGSIAFLLAAPLVTNLSAGIAPSSAATIAVSAAEVNIDNFSRRPAETGTFTNANTQTISNDGFVTSEANANAAFISNCHQLLAQNFSESKVNGGGSRYFGLAQSQASVIGDFFIDAEETFSFAFEAVLHALISVDNPRSERASANGNISFWLIDTVTNILLDSFQLASGLDSSEGILLNLSSSDSFNPTRINFGLLSEGSATKSVFSASGVYSRTFNSAANLRLVEVKNNTAQAEAEPVPEPSAILGTAIFLFGLIKSKKRQHKLSEVQSNVLR